MKENFKLRNTVCSVVHNNIATLMADICATLQYVCVTGVMAVGVPGELKGYWEAHQRYGRLSWEEVIMPAIKICEEGYIMNKHQSDSLGMRSKHIYADPTLRFGSLDINIT
jgi:gamma-glutamyltranspeptidase